MFYFIIFIGVDHLGSLSRRGVGGIMAANTRRLGRKLDITLIKGQFGLGFSLTTRDNPASGNCPIYIKNILPKVRFLFKVYLFYFRFVCVGFFFEILNIFFCLW